MKIPVSKTPNTPKEISKVQAFETVEFSDLVASTLVKEWLSNKDDAAYGELSAISNNPNQT